jgi:hypothetical protein
MNGRIQLCAALLLPALLLPPFTAAAQDHQAAVWRSHELDFQFMGFTTHFSCSGLQGDVRDILLSLGAQDERNMVIPGACSGWEDRPSRISGVHIKVMTLQPAPSTPDASQGPVVDAYWKVVTVGARSEGENCELIEQVKSDILPLFTTRHLKDQNLDCIPHQATAIPSRLTLEVLVPVAPVK